MKTLVILLVDNMLSLHGKLNIWWTLSSHFIYIWAPSITYVDTEPSSSAVTGVLCHFGSEQGLPNHDNLSEMLGVNHFSLKTLTQQYLIHFILLRPDIIQKKSW